MGVAVHEFFGVLLALVVGGVIVSAISPGSQAGAVIGQSASGFATDIQAMKGTQGAQLPMAA